ncbi:uncharacterized protein G2W53_019482 [Senna tora]|uniref:Uncharacterized protein n=1 Tax=Senna tora TaxID=362788 RepID=A0A834WP82_9FABA|nr:uncharacterized protein G2W53_019482 [Senna tora]
MVAELRFSGGALLQPLLFVQLNSGN